MFSSKHYWIIYFQQNMYKCPQQCTSDLLLFCKLTWTVSCIGQDKWFSAVVLIYWCETEAGPTRMASGLFSVGLGSSMHVCSLHFWWMLGINSTLRELQNVWKCLSDREKLTWKYIVLNINLQHPVNSHYTSALISLNCIKLIF